jgi:DNA (cytosine-5)-methyltransferase 1
MNKILDLYCRAGGAGMGYHQGGYEVTGIDNKPQPRYPFKFIQSDAIEYLMEHWKEYDAFHASPPCQLNSTMTKGLWKDRLASHPELIAPTRNILIETGRPYIIENVPTAPLINPTVLCGSMFGLKVRKHRLFETSFMVFQPVCNHKVQGKTVSVYGHSGGSSKRDGLKFPGIAEWKEAMQIYWMIGEELSQAIPPAYTKYISQFIPK